MENIYSNQFRGKCCPLINVRDIIIFFQNLLIWKIINGVISFSHLPIIITIFILYQYNIPFVVGKIFISLALSKQKTIFHNLKPWLLDPDQTVWFNPVNREPFINSVLLTLRTVLCIKSMKLFEPRLNSQV